MARIFSWLFNAAYLAAVVLACPWILWSAWRHGKYREGFSEKFLGRVPRRTSSMPCVWLHAVSVGEVNLLSTLIAEIARRRPHWEIVVSTTTKTGYDLARKKYGEYTVFYAPLDFTWSVRQAMQRVRPNILALAELELWPNVIAAAKEQGAKVAIFNGRLSDKSFRGYRRIRPLVASVLRQVDLIASQNEETSQRFLELGSLPSAVRTSGSLKFDGAILNRNNPRTMEARRIASIADEDVVFLAGSTQDPEELYAIEIFKRLRPEHPRLRLIVVPRHKERFDEAADLLADSGLAWKRRTELEAPSVANRDGTSSRWEALLVDAIGELGAWWGTATVGFVGGSFGSRGGQNMLEPAAYGVAVCFGPNTWNFRDIVSRLLAADGAKVVANAAEFEDFVRRSLEEPAWATKLGERAQELILAQQGATARTVDLLVPLIDEASPANCAA